MHPADFEKEAKEIIKKALEEDIGGGDITSTVIPEEIRCRAHINANESFILAGIRIAMMAFRMIDRNIGFKIIKRDGELVKKGEVIAELTGKVRSILSAERTALNFLQHLSGIATNTRRFVERIKPYRAILLDTRKTTPGLRIMEKYATRVGGAMNHRMGLYDGIMIKTNHIKSLGGIRSALKRFGDQSKKVMMEVKNIHELMEALDSGAGYIMLDNMSIGEIRKAVKYTKGRALLEATGGVTLKNIRKIAATGVDYISAGALTHSARWVNINLRIVEIYEKNRVSK